MHGGDPIKRYGSSSFTFFQAARLCSGLVKSQPFVRSSEEPGTNPYFLATLFTRSGEYTSVRSTPINDNATMWSSILSSFAFWMLSKSVMVLSPGLSEDMVGVLLLGLGSLLDLGPMSSSSFMPSGVLMLYRLTPGARVGVLILTSVGSLDLSCNGSSSEKSPNIAATSSSFSSFFVSSSTSPMFSCSFFFSSLFTISPWPIISSPTWAVR